MLMVKRSDMFSVHKVSIGVKDHVALRTLMKARCALLNVRTPQERGSSTSQSVWAVFEKFPSDGMLPDVPKAPLSRK